MRFLKSTLNPAWYHGRGARPPFFEGWYFKLIDASGQRRYAVIPGVFLGTDQGASHAFVQVLDGTTGHATYHPYPLAEFRAAQDAFDVRVGPNQFSLERISLLIETEEQTVAGDVSFTRLIVWAKAPIGRFERKLRAAHRREAYVSSLAAAFDPARLEGLRCRRQVCVDYDGGLYDCGFNLALGLGVDDGSSSIADFDGAALAGRRVVTGDHCFA